MVIALVHLRLRAEARPLQGLQPRAELHRIGHHAASFDHLLEHAAAKVIRQALKATAPRPMSAYVSSLRQVGRLAMTPPSMGERTLNLPLSGG